MSPPNHIRARFNGYPPVRSHVGWKGKARAEITGIEFQ